MKKKISLVLSIILAFTFLTFTNPTSVRAEDKDVVIGTSNLNNTPENSGKVGDQILKPEKGWKRFNIYKTNIIEKTYTSVLSYGNDDNDIKSIYSLENQKFNVKFSFTGTEFRIIGTSLYDHTTNVSVFVDNNKVGSYNTRSSSTKSSQILFELKNLENKYHNIEIRNESSIRTNLQAIDIAENLELKPYQEAIKPESITLDKSSISLLKEKTENLIATVKPDNAINKEIVWSSSDDKIATVDTQGKVTAVTKGTATITATVKGTDLKATCDVNVTELNKNRAILAITMVNGITKEYDVSADEIESFEKWFDASNGKGQLRYGFNKTIKPYKTVKEYIVFDKIASFEVREYEADK